MSRFVEIIETFVDAAGKYRAVLDVGKEERVMLKFDHEPSAAEAQAVLDALDTATEAIP